MSAQWEERNLFNSKFEIKLHVWRIFIRAMSAVGGDNSKFGHFFQLAHPHSPENNFEMEMSEIWQHIAATANTFVSQWHGILYGVPINEVLIQCEKVSHKIVLSANVVTFIYTICWKRPRFILLLHQSTFSPPSGAICNREVVRKSGFI